MFKQNNHNPTIVFQKKPRYQYVPVKETITSDELGTYVTYGISVRTVSEEIAFVRDVSTELDEIQHLANVCTEQQLDPDHLDDVIQDFLIEGSLIS